MTRSRGCSGELLCTLARSMRILILGGDGYLGWPTAMRFSARGHEVSVVDNFSRRRWHTQHVDRLADPDRLARRPARGLARGLGHGDQAVRGLDRGLRLPRRGDRRDPARGGRPLRRAALGAVLDEVARGGGRDPVHERDRHPQPAVRASATGCPTATWSSSGRWASTGPRTSTSRRGSSRSSTRAARTRSRSRSCRARSTTSRRSTTPTTSTSPAGSGACGRPTSTRASSTGSRPTSRPTTSA